jgi:hypothetical protein
VTAVVAMLALYLQVWWHPVPHIPSLDAAEPALSARLRAGTGGLVLLENTFHRDMDASPVRTSAPTPFTVHFESLLPRTTGRRFYAGMWDGWQWSPERDRLLSGGAFRGRALALTPPADFQTQLARWGVGEIAVWSDASRAFLDANPAFTRTWSEPPWQGYAVTGADTRDVVAASGSALLRDRSPLGATIALQDVHAGDLVVVRTSYHPAWGADAVKADVSIRDAGGQLAFVAPADGTYDVSLRYPRRTWLIVIALSVVAVAAGAPTLFR